MTGTIGIVDIFSGPGGLGEGFSAVRDDRGNPIFAIDVSVEKDEVAHSTLRLRGFLRKFLDGLPEEYIEFLNGEHEEEPDWGELYPQEWEEACEEALNLTLGNKDTAAVLEQRISEIRERRGDCVVLIGGPPCQAYSIAGRGRKPDTKGYVPHPEDRHLLYREYIKVLRQLRPAAFVMENVKGLLSSSTTEGRILDLVMQDLRSGGGAAEYILCPLSAEPDLLKDCRPTDFVVRTEEHGLPQTRHRVIIVGLRRDLFDATGETSRPALERVAAPATVEQLIRKMPRMRSGLSLRQGERDTETVWKAAVAEQARALLAMEIAFPPRKKRAFRRIVAGLTDERTIDAGPREGSDGGTIMWKRCPRVLKDWIANPALTRLTHHETRGHMRSDLGRYLFASAWTAAVGSSPKAEQFPEGLAPEHKNWTTGRFRDRFRVQPWKAPGSTVTCHVSKDGHYFIHPDPSQCRSMTVREVARIQTFPDDYFFKGNRTEQYIQVGNAVPPYLAKLIAEAMQPVLATMLGEQPSIGRRPAIAVFEPELRMPEPA